MPKVGRRRKKTRTHVVDNEGVQSALVSNETLKVPKSLIIRRGKVESEVQELVSDLRKVMLPYTALNFEEDPKNRKHTLSTYSKELAMPMGVSHILAFSQNTQYLNMRLARVPEGPTMTFRVSQFSLVKNVRSIQRRPYTSPGIHQNSPIVVTNNFGDAKAPPHVKLMRITFQNMFPTINVATVKLADCRRVVLFNYMEEEGIVEMRHYAIKATPVGVDRKVRRIVQTKIPNLNRLDDIADYITGTTSSGNAAPAASSGNVSDSEPEDETSHVVLAQKYSGRGNGKQQKSALKLVELGPRMSINLLKVERGLGGGDVMYHSLIKKTPEEVKEVKQRKEKEVMVKKQRREEQDRNVEKKRKIKEEKQDRKRQRKDEREREAMDALRKGAASEDDDDNENGSEEEEEDDSSGEENDQDGEESEDSGDENED